MKHTRLFGKALAVLALGISLFQFSACEEPAADVKTHTVGYLGNGNDSGVPPADQKKYAAGDLVTVAGPGTLGKKGYDFSGWAETASASQALYVAGASFAMPDKDVTLFAVWAKHAADPGVPDNPGEPDEPDEPDTPAVKTHAVSFASNGGTSIASQTIIEGNKIVKPVDPTKDQYSFLGWYRDAEFATLWNFNSDTVGSDVTLYAKWQKNEPAVIKHIVTFESNGGSAIEPQTIVENATVTRPEDPVWDHHTFIGWYRDDKLATPWNFGSDPVTGNVTLYAKWLAYTVTYNGNGNYNGSAPADSGPFTAGESFVAASSGDLAKRGYAFAGWSESKTATTATYEAGKTYPISGKNYTLYAVWKQIQSLSFTYQLDTNTAIQNYYYPGDIITILGPSSATKENYICRGWSGISNSTTATYKGGETFTMPASRVTLYPVFEYVPLIVYDAGSTGTITGASSQRIGKNASGTEVTAVANAGYHFLAWSDGKTTATRQDSNFTKDTTITALFEKDLGITYPGPTKESVTISCANTALHKTGSNASLAASVSAAYSSYAWYIDGTDAQVSKNSIAFDISNLDIGAHTVAVVVTKNGTPYSSQMNFTVIY